MLVHAMLMRDHTLSMSSRRTAAMADFNAAIAEIASSARENGVKTLVSVVEIGRSWNDGPATVVYGAPPESIEKMCVYPTPGRSTRLYDGVGWMIERGKTLSDAHPNESVVTLISVITDGQENNSRDWSIEMLRREIAELTKTDLWSFAFRVPKGDGEKVAREFGIGVDNVLEWSPSVKGSLEAATQVNVGATHAYMAGVARGVTSTQSFYRGHVDQSLAAVAVGDDGVKDVWPDVRVYVSNDDNSTVRSIFEERGPRGVDFPRGKLFYELTKHEKKIQPAKKIIVRDRASGKAYSGSIARATLGWPVDRDISASPGNHDNFDIFVQSTSYNRKVPRGDMLLYWPGA